MPDELIDIIMDIDDKYISDYPISQEEYSVKEDLMAKYYETYDYHQNSISDSTIRDYMENRSEIKRLYQRKLELGRDISIN